MPLKNSKNLLALEHYIDSARIKKFGKKDLDILMVIIPEMESFLKSKKYQVNNSDIDDFVSEWIIKNSKKPTKSTSV